MLNVECSYILSICLYMRIHVIKIKIEFLNKVVHVDCEQLAAALSKASKFDSKYNLSTLHGKHEDY